MAANEPGLTWLEYSRFPGRSTFDTSWGAEHVRDQTCFLLSFKLSLSVAGKEERFPAGGGCAECSEDP